jgi:hypothetical protein
MINKKSCTVVNLNDTFSNKDNDVKQ